MELRYCEKCGDVIRVETDEPLSPTDHFICEQCRTGAVPAAEGKPQAQSEDEVEKAFQNVNLNLFSPDTVAFRKKRLAEEGASEQSKTGRLRLVTAGSGEASEESPAQAQEAADASPPQAQKVLFRCLHCRATLCIRPVDRTSKVTCPHCANPIYVTPAGKLHKTPPSSVLHKGEGLLHQCGAEDAARTAKGAKSGSSVRLKPASAAVKKPDSSAVKKAAGSAAVMAPGSQALSAPASSSQPTGSSRGISRAAPPGAGGVGGSFLGTTGSAAVAKAGRVGLRIIGSQAIAKSEDPLGLPSAGPLKSVPGRTGLQLQGSTGSQAIRKAGSQAIRKAGSQAVPKLEPAGGILAAGSAQLPQSVLSGSQAIRKAGSQAVPKLEPAGGILAAGSAQLPQSVLSGSKAIRKAGSQAVPKWEPAGGTLEAGSAQLPPSALSGSQAIRKAGSQALPRTGSVRVRSGSARVAPQGAGSLRLDPPFPTPASGSQTPKQPSAFQEHHANRDPRKTAFITEEATSDLSAIASGDSLAKIPPPQCLLPSGELPAVETSPDEMPDLCPEELDLLQYPAGKPAASTEENMCVAQAASVPAAPAPRKRAGTALDGLFYGLFLVLCLCAPILFVQGYLPSQATAIGKTKGAARGQSYSLFDTLGKAGSQGIRVLLAKSPGH